MIKRVLFGAFALAALVLSFELGRIFTTSTGVFQARQFFNSFQISANSQPANIDLTLFWDVWNAVHDQYYGQESLDDQALVYGAIKGMVKTSGDKYGEFFTPSETKNFLEAISGSFEGIGAEITSRAGQIVIVAPLKDTPAEKAGLKSGDLILKIDDDNTFEMSLEHAVSLIKGPKGSSVSLFVSRPEAPQPFEVTITRARIDVPTVEAKMIENSPGVGYVGISTFNDAAPREFRRAIQRLKNTGLNRLIIDLRNNPGGILDSAVEVASVLTGPNVVIALEKMRVGEPIEHKTVGERAIEKLPLVILVNNGTASAAEILAGALKEIQGAVIVGETTFGKGSVQSYAELGNKSSLKITTALWFTPQGNSIEGDGLVPDQAVKEEPITAGEPGPDLILEKALELLKGP